MKRYPITKYELVLALAALALISVPSGAQPQVCGPYPGCLYVPPASYGIDGTAAVVRYTDLTGFQRNVPIAIRRPAGKPGPLPVVIWVHGGGEGHSNPVTSMEDWSRVTAQAGYLTIAGAHELREGASRERLCTALGVSPSDCPGFQPLHWDRPRDITAIIDELIRMNSQGPWQGQIDVNRIAVGGHSAGSAAALTIAGARRLVISPTVLMNLTDPRPIAFLGFSPQGPGHIGFFETDFRQPLTSWDSATRPVLMATGDGDSNCEGQTRDVCEDTPQLRRIAFDRIRPPDKYMMYINDADTFHNIFALKTSECADKNVSAEDCTAFESWLESSALAFLDFHVLGRPAALAWLQAPYLKLASRGVTGLERK